MANEVVTVADALARLSEGLSTTQKHSIGSFHEFIIDIWSQSFERPELFNTWHVGVIAEDAERALADGKIMWQSYHASTLRVLY